MARGDLSQESCHHSIKHTDVIIAHDRETWLEQSGGERMGGLQRRLILKGPEECPSGCRWKVRGVALGVEEAVGQGGHFNDDNP